MAINLKIEKTAGMKHILISTLLILLGALTLNAQNLLIDFGLSNQQTSGNWNNVAANSGYRFTDAETLLLENMIDDAGAATTIDFYLVGLSPNASSGPGGTDYNVATNTSYPLSATRDLYFINTGLSVASATFELRGLTPNGVYDLTFFAGVAIAGRMDTNWDVDGSLVTLDPENNLDSVTLGNAIANGSGVITIDWYTSAANSAAYWNTFQITAVPEPSLYAGILGVVVLGSIFMRRKWRGR